MQRFKLVAVIALSLAVLAGCAGEAPVRQTVTGTVETVKSEGTGSNPHRYFMLEDSTDVFHCIVDDVQDCIVLEKGQTVTMQVNENLTIHSLEYTES